MEEEVFEDGEQSIHSAAEEDLNDNILDMYTTRGSSATTLTPIKTKAGPQRRVPLTKVAATEQGLRNRMVPEGREYLKGTNDRIYIQNYGPDLDDLYPIIQSRDVWHINSRDVTLPSRQSIISALKLLPKGYLKPPLSVQPKSTAKETSNNGLASLQTASIISHDDAYAKKYLEVSPSHDIVLGPWGTARKFRLEYMQPLDVSQAWTRSQPLGERLPISDADRNAWHKGWLLNFSARPQHLAWAPVESENQFLAVALKCSQAQRDAAPLVPIKLAPAFSPSPAFPSQVQIWRIKAILTNQHTPAFVDYDTPPQLSQVLCTKWGNILRIEWSPLLDAVSLPSSSQRRLTLLSSDGCVRLVNIDLEDHAETKYLECQQPDLIAQPPSHTIHTTFCWASSHDLIIGGADGAVRVYNCETSDTTGILQPYLTVQVHNTYVMAVSVPMETPHFLCSTSASGEMTLTDLRSPTIDRLPIHKARLPTRNLSYLPFARMFVTTNDASGNSQTDGTALSTIVCHSLRHFYASKTILKLPEASGITTCLATSQFHPCLLVANAQGSVWASNHLRRCLPMAAGTAIDISGSGWMQKIYEYDWQPLTPSPPSQHPLSEGPPTADQTPTHQFISPPTLPPTNPRPKIEIDIYHGADVKPGISRLHEGFRPERIEVAAPHKKPSKPTLQDAVPSSDKLASAQLIFHEEQGVSAMSWNPNPRFAGWCAVAWGSGVVRIGDLAHDGL